ncbi:hypothetical protein I302_106300 [Kwoniella bestiolae CBS 10118]|uniref:PPM-type phosphatase domain-containing protein n=1 Tax=Kwoniella bestiolae CBS 10118 TaxID=1296100 RepID=A0A1B9G3K3_9TREE|nr:hypothetical protein I302_05424 [Kwoniella bestiolae CBS 10118]OCF25604.1 hypothetical protein I302_05424 [Kwoniella bestiolae CBS 10118]
MSSLNPIKLNELPASPIIKTTQSDGNEAFIQLLPGPLVKVWGQFGPNDAPNRDWEGTFYIRPEKEIEEFMKRNAKSFSIPLEHGPVKGWDEIVVPSNPLCEDRHKIDIGPSDQFQRLLKCAEDKGGAFWKAWYEATKIIPVTDIRAAQVNKGDTGDVTSDHQLMFFSVFDGMGGNIFSDMISKTLHACLALTIARLKAESDSSIVNQERLSWALTDTFTAVDQELLHAPVSALKGLLGREDSSPILPKLGPSNFLFGATEGSGCTACTLIVDTAASRLYVAHIGDSRAVAGWYNSKEGKWRCDVLTEDQCGDNPKECARRLSRHPPEEAEQVIYDRGWGNRVLGTNDVVRKFGGSFSKRSHEEEEEIWNTFQTKQAFNFFKRKTPPYTDAEAAVTYRDLKSNPDEELKFVILATDGIWDRLTSEEAVLLTAAYRDEPSQGDVAKTDLAKKYPMMSPSEPRPFPAQDLPGMSTRTEGTWSFDGDADAGTHLIRNVLGGADREWRRQVLSMRELAARQMRDDLTAV